MLFFPVAGIGLVRVLACMCVKCSIVDALENVKWPSLVTHNCEGVSVATNPADLCVSSYSYTTGGMC